MAKFKREVRDLKTVRETEMMIARRFRRSLDGLDYDRLRDDLRAMMDNGERRGAFPVFYFKFTFNVLDVDSDDVSAEIQKYILENLKRRFKGRFDAIEGSPSSDMKGWPIVSRAFLNREGEFESFLSGLEAFFDSEVLAKFNVEVDHEIYLTGAVLVLKKPRREKKARKGARKKRKPSRTKVVVYQIKGHKKRKRRPTGRALKRRAGRIQRRRQTGKRKAVRHVKRSGKVTAKKRKRVKKSRRF